MAEWKRVRLGEVCSKVGSGATPLGGNRAYCDQGIALIRSQNVIDFQFTTNGLAFINQKQAAKLSGVSVEKGDVLLNITGDSVARVCIVPERVLPARVNQHVCILRPRHDILNSTFLQATIFSLKDKLLTIASAGATRNALTKADILELDIYLPPLATQRKIAAVLGAIDDKIETNRKICANLEAQAQALFKSWFVDFEPFGGKMPKGWKMGKLGDVAECNPYRALKKGVKARCVEMADLVTSASFPASWSYKEYSGGMKFANGDTIIARITPCFENGKSAYVNFLEEGEVAFGSTEYVVMASRSVVPPELFYCVAKDPEFISFAKSRMVGSSGRQRFSAEDIAMYPIVIAPDEVYLKVQPLLHSFMNQARTLGFESRALAATRDALLPKLMSGEIDVEKVEVV